MVTISNTEFTSNISLEAILNVMTEAGKKGNTSTFNG